MTDTSYIEKKKEEKAGPSKDIRFGPFVTHVLIGITIVILFTYIACVNLFLTYKYSVKGLAATNPFLVPYTPFNKMSEYVMHRGKESFKRWKIMGGMKMPSLDDVFPMESWAFPYKNTFTEKQYEKTYDENMNDTLFRTTSWFTDTTANSYATGRYFLQLYFSLTKRIITIIDDGSKPENKYGENIVFLFGTVLFLLLMTVLSPLYAFLSVTAYSMLNIRKALPSFFGINFSTFLYLIFIIPVLFNILFIVGGTILHASINSFIMPIILLVFILIPIFQKESRKAIFDLMFSKKRTATFFIMVSIISGTFLYLGNEIGLYSSVAGIIFLLLFLFDLV